MTLAEYGFSADLGLGQMLVTDTITGSPHPGRLAPNTALAFVLCGAALWSVSRRRLSDKTPTVAGVLGAVVLAIGAASVLGYAAGYPTYAWGQFTQMAASTGCGFIALGAGMVTTASAGSGGIGPPRRSGSSIATGFGGLTITLSFWYALERRLQFDTGRILAFGYGLGNRSQGSAFPALRQDAMFLVTVGTVIGIVGSVLLGLLVHIALTGRRQQKALQLANEKLGKEIVDRTRADEKLLASEQRFRSAFEHAPYGICLTSIEGRLLQVNRTFCELVGSTEAELVAGSWADVTHPRIWAHPGKPSSGCCPTRLPPSNSKNDTSGSRGMSYRQD